VRVIGDERFGLVEAGVGGCPIEAGRRHGGAPQIRLPFAIERRVIEPFGSTFVILRKDFAGGHHQAHFRVLGQARVLPLAKIQHARRLAEQAVREVEPGEFQPCGGKPVFGRSCDSALQRLAVLHIRWGPAAPPGSKVEQPWPFGP
jgi:hypothetical protein